MMVLMVMKKALGKQVTIVLVVEVEVAAVEVVVVMLVTPQSWVGLIATYNLSVLEKGLRQCLLPCLMLPNRPSSVIPLPILPLPLLYPLSRPHTPPCITASMNPYLALIDSHTSCYLTPLHATTDASCSCPCFPLLPLPPPTTGTYPPHHHPSPRPAVAVARLSP